VLAWSGGCFAVTARAWPTTGAGHAVLQPTATRRIWDATRSWRHRQGQENDDGANDLLERDAVHSSRQGARVDKGQDTPCGLIYSKTGR